MTPKRVQLIIADPLSNEPIIESYPSEGYDTISSFYACREGQGWSYDLIQENRNAGRYHRVRGIAKKIEESTS